MGRLHGFWPVLGKRALAGGCTVLLLSFATRAEERKGEPSSVPPKGAIVLFDGKDLSGWTKRNGEPAAWKVQDGYMEVVPHKGDIMTKQKFGPAFKLHVEFWLPL